MEDTTLMETQLDATLKRDDTLEVEDPEDVTTIDDTEVDEDVEQVSRQENTLKDEEYENTISLDCDETPVVVEVVKQQEDDDEVDEAEEDTEVDEEEDIEEDTEVDEEVDEVDEEVDEVDEEDNEEPIKRILLYVNGNEREMLEVNRSNNIKDLKVFFTHNYRYTNFHFYPNQNQEIPVSNTDQYDEVTLESVWSILKNPYIDLLYEKEAIRDQVVPILDKFIELCSKFEKHAYYVRTYDSDQTKFESLAMKSEIGVIACDEIMGAVANRFLRYIIDNNYVLFPNELEGYERERKTESYTESFEEYLAKQEDLVDEVELEKATGDLWTLERIRDYYLK